MTRRRWIADEFSEDRAALTGDHAGHLIRVLRAKVGQEFDIAAGNSLRRGRVSSIEDGRIEFELGESVLFAGVPEISILLAIFKFDRFEWALEKCTELGVRRIIPVIARRSDAHLAAAAGKRAERWRRIVQQAAEQARRLTPPEVVEPVKFREALAGASGASIVLAESEETTWLRDAIEAADTQSGLALAIGPEGGWADEEVSGFQQKGWTSASLGRTILRAETAAIAATAIAVATLSS